MSDDTYNGWKNRETWVFWLWVTNDQGWYESVREFAADRLASSETDEYPTYPDEYLGRAVVDYVKETLDEFAEMYARNDAYLTPQQAARERVAHDQIRAMRDDIGSFWRIDYAEIGAAAREMVEES